MPPEAIEKAAHWFGESRRAMPLHARGLEHQSKGVENCEAVVAIAWPPAISAAKARAAS